MVLTESCQTAWKRACELQAGWKMCVGPVSTMSGMTAQTTAASLSNTAATRSSRSPNLHRAFRGSLC